MAGVVQDTLVVHEHASPLFSSKKGKLEVAIHCPTVSVSAPQLTQLDDADSKRTVNLLASPRTALLARAPVVQELPLLQLSRALAQSFEQEKALLPPGTQLDAHLPHESIARLDAAVRNLVGAYLAAGAQDWQSFVMFNDHHYVRHLVDANDDFELMLICWKSGQYSRVHNHASSHCWLTLLSGEVEEEAYEISPDGVASMRPGSPRPVMPGVLEVGEQCPELRETGKTTLQPCQTSYINDSLGLHRVGCPHHTPAPGAVTLHLYVPPIRKVKLYEPDEGRVIVRVPGFFSIRGRRCTNQ